MGEERLDRSGFVLEFEETFASGELDRDRWVDHYLPEWTTPDRSVARYDLEPGLLRLRIDADQPAWQPDEGELRVSNLQTGTFSGAAGAHRGQSRHRPDLEVRTPQPARRLYTPTSGLAECELRCSHDRTCMAAFWLIGHEEGSEDDSGELCCVEVFGTNIEDGRCGLSIGVKQLNDPRLETDMAIVTLDLDPAEWHTYGVAWTADEARFYVDDDLVRTVGQGVDYPLQLMVDLFEFPEGEHRDPADYPKWAEVRAVRGYRHA